MKHEGGNHLKNRGGDWTYVASSQRMLGTTRKERDKEGPSSRGFREKEAPLTLQNYEKINVCYFKPPSLYFIREALGN